MHKFSASLLAIFVISNAWGDVRLPVVNVASAGVSARAAFGEEIVNQKTVSVAPVVKTRSVVARPAVKQTKVSHGEKLATADILIPNRPSSDLWATNDAPLRMPRPSEFAVLNSDFDLPEEDLE